MKWDLGHYGLKPSYLKTKLIENIEILPKSLEKIGYFLQQMQSNVGGLVQCAKFVRGRPSGIWSWTVWCWLQLRNWTQPERDSNYGTNPTNQMQFQPKEQIQTERKKMMHTNNYMEFDFEKRNK